MKICQPKECTGCGLCVTICPVNAVSMKYNENGVIVSHVNKKCINCGNCKRYCPSNNTKYCFHENSKVYACFTKNKKERRTSTSGGVAAVFTKKILEEGGCGVGTVFMNQKVETILIKNQEEVDLVKGSKYVQSDATKIYSAVAEMLSSGKRVVFIGTPCQNAAILKFVGERDNLITVDLVCHGVPSQRYMKEHIQYVYDGENWEDVTFRKIDKVIFDLKDKKGKKVYKGNIENDNYVRAFSLGITFRESCYNCQFARKERITDITIGDFWGLGNNVAYPHDRRAGVSLVMVHTEKGRAFFESCRESFNVVERTIEEAVEGNEQLRTPKVSAYPKHKNFLEYYQKIGFDDAVEKVMGEPDSNIMLYHLNNFISFFKSKIRMFIGPGTVIILKRICMKKG